MICPVCNQQNREDAKFCKKCGYRFQTQAAVGSDVAQPAPMNRPDPVNEEASPPLYQGDDISLAPTLILTPEKMMTYHNQRWQQEASQPVGTGSTSLPADEPKTRREAGFPQESGASAEGGGPAPRVTPEHAVLAAQQRWRDGSVPGPVLGTVTQAETDIADMPTIVPAPETPPVPDTGEPPGDVRAGLAPAQEISPAAGDDEVIPVPPSPPSPQAQPPSTQDEPATPQPHSTDVGASDAARGPVEEGDPGAVTNETQMNAREEADSVELVSQQPDEAAQPANASADTGDEMAEGVVGPGEARAPALGEGTDMPATTEPMSDFPTLASSTLVAGRYEITQVVSENEQEHVYQVIDRQGYQRCWNCGSEQNATGDEFCANCGAGLLNAPYVMHEYPATAKPEEDARVLQGTIVNTFIDRGRTYVIVQPQIAQNAFPEGVHLLVAADSDAGDVRRSEPNEDSTLVLFLERTHESISEPSGVFIVADGMGGHANGQVASRMAINIIAERLLRDQLAAPLQTEKAGEAKKPLDEDAYGAMLQGAVEDANTAICQVNQRDKTDMGSTVTGFMVVGDHAYIINVGDSRTYLQRGGQLYKLTNDHSLVEQLVAGGLIEPDEVYTHPQRNQIFRSLGDKLNVQVDIFKQQLHPGDIILSCCDGLWEMVRNPQIESILNASPDPQTACSQLIEAANTNGGEDNISVVLVYVR